MKGIKPIKTKRADGSELIYYYHRDTGRRIYGEPGSPKFANSLREAERAYKMRFSAGTVAELIRKFEASTYYEKLGKTTKDEYRRKFRIVDAKWGSCPTSALSDLAFKRDVLAWHEKLAKKAPREADNLVLALARVLSYAYEKAMIPMNILDKFARAYKSDRSEMIWLPQHVEAFMENCTPQMLTALMLGLHTGQREGDLIRLPWAAYDGTHITLKQSKGGRRLTIRCTTALKSYLDGLPRTGDLILMSKKNMPYKKRNFCQRWQESCENAGIKDLHYHDLRGTAVTMLFEAGCTVAEAASITGHSLKRAQEILDVYLARTKVLSDAAIEKLETHPRMLLEKSGKSGKVPTVELG